MANHIALRFLGTSSQTGASRNYSSLLVKINNHAAMVDCGEATQRQLLSRYVGGDDRIGSIRHIFITHLHADHVLGIVPLLLSMMGPTGNAVPESSVKTPRVEIFGPSGLRALIRTTLTLCYSQLSGSYTVHELLWEGQAAYPNAALTSIRGTPVAASAPEMDASLKGAKLGALRFIPHLPPHENELPGMDFRMDNESCSWPNIASVGGVAVSAAPILHRCPTVGYVFDEPDGASPVPQGVIDLLRANSKQLLEQQNIRNPLMLLGKLTKDRVAVELPDGTVLQPPPLSVPGRRIVVLGDTYDATGGLDVASAEDGSEAEPHASTGPRGMLALARDADVVVHECTNAAMSDRVLAKGLKVEKRDEVRAKALLRGHSTPQVAGAFAGRIGARQLLLNHFSIKYPTPTSAGGWTGPAAKKENEKRRAVMREIEEQATEAWHASLRSPSDHVAKMHEQSARRRRAVATWDGFVYRVPRRDEGDEEDKTLSEHDGTPSANVNDGGEEGDDEDDDRASTAASSIAGPREPAQTAMSRRSNGSGHRGSRGNSRGGGVARRGRGAARGAGLPTGPRSSAT